MKGSYDPKKAQHKSYVRRHNASYRGKWIVDRPQLRDFVEGALLDGQSSSAIAGRLKYQEKDLPDVLIMDEPELGLHPYAINIISGLLKSISLKTQVIIATQSTNLIDNFDPKDIVIVEREGRETGAEYILGPARD